MRARHSGGTRCERHLKGGVGGRRKKKKEAIICIYFLCFLWREREGGSGATAECATKLSAGETQSASGEERARDASVCLGEREGERESW